jgi:hypothetical protein
LLFSVGGIQLKATLVLELDAGGVAGVVEPDELPPPLVDPVSATVVGVVALLVATLEIPESLLPPQPASVSAVLANKVNPKKRPARSAFRMLPPPYGFQCRSGRSHIQEVARAYSTA